MLTLITYMPEWYLIAITAIFIKEGETGEHKKTVGHLSCISHENIHYQ